MTTFTRTRLAFATRILPFALTVLVGCAQLDELMEGESVDYRSTVRSEPLTIPPDLTQTTQNAQYRTGGSPGTTTFSQYTEGQRPQASGAQNVLPQPSDMTVMRDGSLRWLLVDRPAEDIYPKVVDFWLTQGFTIFSQNPGAGLIETDWAENRKKIPESWLRSVLTIIDQVFDSGERERFRTRLERVNGGTEIYISHEQMVETAETESTFRWIPGKEDPNLNAAMLARLMVFLGSSEEQARARIAQSQDVTPAAPLMQTTQDATTLTLAESFDRAWRRVGIAIDAAGFSLEDRDRSAGDYYIRYLDTDTGVKREQGNFFTRLFSSSSSLTEAEQFRIHVQEQDGNSLVTVLNAQGQREDSATAQRILSVLSTQMTAQR